MVSTKSKVNTRNLSIWYLILQYNSKIFVVCSAKYLQIDTNYIISSITTNIPYKSTSTHEII